MATGMRGSPKEEMRSIERAGEPLSSKDVKLESFSGVETGYKGTDVKSTTLRSKKLSVGEDGVKSPASSNKVSSVFLPKSLLRKSIAPILSMKRVRLTKDSTGHFFVFLLKLAALEAVRRGTIAKCPQIWWGLQGISLFQAPPFSWFQRWGPIRQLVQGTESFSKPMFVLSLATAVTGAVEEIQQASQPNLLDRVLTPESSLITRTDARVSPCRRVQTLNRLKRELRSAEIELPERINDDELERFLVAANKNLAKFVSIVKKTVSWRESYYFLNALELRTWSPLVFWHDEDQNSRPTLYIRLGLAYTTLQPEDRPRFCQAVVSQVEHGILHLVHEEDPRITVILDCEGTTCVGFPVAMMKSCSVLVQEHYPTRLAALFAVNLPPVVRVVANAVLQVVRPVTREKVTLLGDVFLGSLSEFLGGTDKVPSYLGGSCHCAKCLEDRKSEGVYQISSERAPYGQIRHEEEEDEEVTEESGYHEERITTDYQSYNSSLRVAIVGLLMLWVVIAMVAALQEPQLLPT
ncbi:hypothetical protein MPTK1_1g14630 [Marchantia polymorpha subsp. ruderalis]